MFCFSSDRSSPQALLPPPQDLGRSLIAVPHDIDRPIPFYSVKLFREECIVRILQDLNRPPPTALSALPGGAGGGGSGRSGAGGGGVGSSSESRPDVLAIMQRYEVALAEKDADIQHLTASYKMQMEKKDREVAELQRKLAMAQQLTRQPVDGILTHPVELELELELEPEPELVARDGTLLHMEPEPEPEPEQIEEGIPPAG